MTEYTPMMQHYLKTHEEYKDCILFYRLGDFYEMFFDDAKVVSKELELTLTGKSCGAEERAPMCGIPYHAAETYLTRLVKKGYKVAICEQVEDPKLAKGMVKREVTRVVTPGTTLNAQALDETKNNYIMCIAYIGDHYGISSADITTGDYYVTEVDSERKLLDEVNKYQPTEIICNEAFYISGIDIDDMKNRMGIVVYSLDAWYFSDETAQMTLKDHFKVRDLEGLGLADYDSGVIAAGALLKYLYETQKTTLSNLVAIHPYTTGKFMIIDSSTRRNLELVETLREKQKRGSLLWVLDKTRTAMGARTLRSFVEQPLIERAEIEERYDAIDEFNTNAITREEIREYLNPVYDLERLITRVTYQTANPRDLIAFRNSIHMLPPIKTLMSDFQSPLLKRLYEQLDTLDELYELIERSIAEEPPLTLHDGGILKEGYNEEVDRLRKAKTDGKSWLADLEAKEREKTGIKNLKIKYNKVFDYYFEVTNSFKSLVPDYFIRKQTLVNAERFTTDELNTLSGKILGAEDKLYALEYDCYVELREKLAAALVRVQKMAGYIAELDALCSLAYVADKNNYVRPSLNTDGVIDIKGGRHPVVEKMLANDSFVENDTYLNNAESRISIITGPNMAGKSTYMRQTALITLMAQIGSFVPAESANIGLCDRIFTRVGASDDLASGQSTFMIEMNEVANILRNATKDSLLILDEIGRGTSTFDGLSIAWAVVEYIADPNILGAKTLFATHYHELTELEGKLSSVNNFCIAVQEEGDDIVFLRKIIKGGADRSYGIQVARLAGVPEPVLKRAREICNELIDSDITTKVKDIDIKPALSEQPKKKETRSSDYEQLSLFSSPVEMTIANELKTMDLNNMTPIKAMLYLQELQERLKQQ